MIDRMNFLRKEWAYIPIGILALVLFSCSDDETGAAVHEPSFNSLGRYEYSIRESQDTLLVQLDGIKADIVKVESHMDWLSITGHGKDGEGVNLLQIARVQKTPTHFDCDSAFVYFSDKERATIVITASQVLTPPSDNSSGEYAAFNNKWWEQQEILYSVTRSINGKIEITSEHIPLPWAPAATSNIPSTLYAQESMTPNEGWVMAYNLFAAETNGHPNSKPYFMLYNKYTGHLRVFYYQAAQAGSGGEFSFVVTPEDPFSAKYPYYHSMQYGIPVCNREVQLQGNVLKVTQGNNGFQQMITPYLKADGVLKPGWYCFDMDWSAYAPTLKAPFLVQDRMCIDCMTATTLKITLAGTITGTMEGTMEGLSNSSTTTSNGVNYVNQMNGGATNAAGAFTDLLAGNFLSAAFKGAMSLWNFGKALTGNATDDYTTESKSTGSINMSLTGKINLDGYATTNTSNNATGVEFSYAAFLQNDLVGRGSWSLADNPTVYIVKDCLMGEDEDIVCVVNQDGYSIGDVDPSKYHLRLMTFFDPTSITFNLNTALYKNIRNAKMSWTYGVYPNQEAGHTDGYRNGMMQFTEKGWLNTPEFINKTKYDQKVYKSYLHDFANMNYLEYPLEKMTITYLKNSSVPKIYQQQGADYAYYAHAGNDRPESDKDFFLVDPVVMLPTTFTKDKEEDSKKEEEEEAHGKGMFYDMIVPDFVVGVTLTFDYDLDDGSKAKAVLSKRFLPQTKLISTAELVKKKEELRQYVQRSEHQRIGSLTIHHSGASDLLRQFFATSDFIINNNQ